MYIWKSKVGWIHRDKWQKVIKTSKLFYNTIDTISAQVSSKVRATELKMDRNRQKLLKVITEKRTKGHVESTRE